MTNINICVYKINAKCKLAFFSILDSAYGIVLKYQPNLSPSYNITKVATKNNSEHYKSLDSVGMSSIILGISQFPIYAFIKNIWSDERIG